MQKMEKKQLENFVEGKGLQLFQRLCLRNLRYQRSLYRSQGCRKVEKIGGSSSKQRCNSGGTCGATLVMLGQNRLELVLSSWNRVFKVSENVGATH